MDIQNTFLPLLLYMSPDIGLIPQQLTQNCTVFDSNTAIVSCNRVVHNLTPSENDIETVLSFFGEREFTWAVSEQDIAGKQALDDSGLQDFGVFNAMVLDTTKIVGMPCKDENINVEKIDLSDIAVRDLWISITLQSFTFAQQDQLQKLLENFNARISSGSLASYIGYYHNKPVAAGMMINHGAIASLHWISTLPQFRKKGVSSVLTQTMLLEALNAKCSQIVLLSSKMGKPIYKRLGFVDCGGYHLYGN